MNDVIIKVNYDDCDKPTVLGRDLHEFLGVDSNYTTWFKRMCEYGFTEGIDFFPFLEESTGGRPAVDHQITISMAKEICMIQRSEKGKIARQYFIKLEEAWNTPEMVMSRALKMANDKINQLSVEIASMKPKADYFDALVDSNLLTNFRTTAKEIGVSQKQLIAWLGEHKYIYKDMRGAIQPYMNHVEAGLFEIKDKRSPRSSWVGTQTFITPKGKETFRLLIGSTNIM